jgi:DNA polymerase-3 subunit alpha
VDAITERTKGQIIYQEQILQILKDIGGFDWFSVGQIRRIISKKVGEAAFQMSYGKFEEGAARLHGMDAKLADRIWKLLVTSGTYSFVTAHAVSYTLIGYWCMWLKVHYPVEFYAAALSKTGDEEQQFKLMRDALAHELAVRPPDLNRSAASWSAQDGELVAGWRQIPGVADKTAAKIAEHRPADGWASWAALQVVPGIGPKKIQTMSDFAFAADPFRLRLTEERLLKVRKWLKTNRNIPYPTHNGDMIAAIPVREEYGSGAAKERKRNYGKGPRVVYLCVVRERNMQDAVENRRSRTGEEADAILKEMHRPELLEYCSLRCFDDSDEEVYLRINRFTFPRLRGAIESISVGHDLVVAVGNRIAGFGTPVMVRELYVIDPDD